jgi:hypothetical protein
LFAPVGQLSIRCVQPLAVRAVNAAQGEGDRRSLERAPGAG